MKNTAVSPAISPPGCTYDANGNPSPSYPNDTHIVRYTCGDSAGNTIMTPVSAWRAAGLAALTGVTALPLRASTFMPRTQVCRIVAWNRWRMLQGASSESDQPIMTASVSGAVVESARACPVSGITTTFRCAAGA